VPRTREGIVDPKPRAPHLGADELDSLRFPRRSQAEPQSSRVLAAPSCTRMRHGACRTRPGMAMPPVWRIPF
jgi:hypothetical protein